MSKGELVAIPGEETISPVSVTPKYATSDYWPLEDLKLWDKNPRSIKDDRFKELKARLSRQGQVKPLLVTKNGTVIGGNMRLRAMTELHWDKVWVSVTEADTDKEIFDLALTDNEEFGYYEQEQLAELALSIGLSPLELKTYEVSLGETTTLDLVVDKFGPEEVEEDEVPEVDETSEPESRLGEIYQLGRHRLMCGDSTDKDAISELTQGSKPDLVYTDPPYGMFLDADYSSMKNSLDFAKAKNFTGGKKYENVIGDHDDFNPAFISTIFEMYPKAKEVFLWGADYYTELLPNRNAGSWVVWDKRLDDSADKMYGSTFELCWSKNRHKRDMVRVKWAGVFGTEQEFDHKRHHPTQKPVALSRWFIERYSEVGNTVLDLFGGSGSTLIASEETGRLCYMMELDPKYCDVIRKRYANHIGEGERWQEVTPAVKELVNASR